MSKGELQPGRLSEISVQEQIAEIRKRIEGEKVDLSSEIVDFVRTNLRSVQEKLLGNKPIYPRDIEFIAKLKLWMSMPKEWREKNSTPETVVIAPEVKEIAGRLEKDYRRSIETLNFFDLIKSEKPDAMSTGRQEYFYEADYGEFVGQEIVMPSFGEILLRMTPKEVQLYKEMKKQGLEPKLQITPIGYSLATLKTRIDAKKDEFKGPGITTFNGLNVWDGIKENELKYAPSNIAATPDGKQLIVEGGLSKAEWIEKNDGFIIEIVAMKSDLSANPALQQNAKGEWLFNGDQTANLYQEMMENGYSGLSYESYALAGAKAVKNGKPLEPGCFTVLPESNLPNSQHLSAGFWGGGRVYLGGHDTDLRNYDLRCRRSVRVKLR